MKKSIKKLVAGVVTVLLLLTGCGTDTNEKGKVTDTDEKTETETMTEEQTTAEKEKNTTASGNSGSSASRLDILNSYKFKNPWKTGYEETGYDGETVHIKEVKIDIAGDGEEIVIYQLTDCHFNNSYDTDSTDKEDATVLASWNEWGKAFCDFDTVILPTFKRCMNLASTGDKVVITGDIANFYSKANYSAIEKYIFNADKNINAELAGKVLATSGNHDCTFPGARKNIELYESHHKELEDLYAKYGYDLEYTSQVIDDRVMIVVLDNASRYDISSERYTENQLNRLTADIATAKEKGYTMLLFGHVPLPTQNTAGHSFYVTYDMDAYSDEHPTSKAVYKLIINNADIIKGYFCGHNHGDTYLEIIAKTSDGKPAYIPQYVLNDMCLGKQGSTGEMTRIILK